MKIVNKNVNSGQSLFELVLAMGVVSIIVVVLVSLVNNTLQNAAYSSNRTLAARLAEDGTEWVRSERDRDTPGFIAKTSSVPLSWCLKDNPLVPITSWNQHSACGTTVVSGTIFIRQVNFVTTTVSGKTIITADVKVSWTDSKGTHSVLSSTQFSDWRQR